MAEYIDRDEVFRAMKIEIRPPFCSRARFPAADVIPVVHGKWLSCFEDWRMQIEGDKCSICGFEHYGTPRGTFKFCPNCGAKMDGGQA